jgi:hypothetical protein
MAHSLVVQDLKNSLFYAAFYQSLDLNLVYSLFIFVKQMYIFLFWFSLDTFIHLEQVISF